MATKAADEFDNIVLEEKQPFIFINKAAFKRVGVILRLASLLVMVIGFVLAILLPMVAIDYATYSNTSTFSPERASRFATEYVYGANNLFGGQLFAYYLKSVNGAEILTTQVANFNGILFGVVIFGILMMALAFIVTFSRKMEKWSKLVILGFIVVGLGFLFSPVFFLSINRFGNNYYNSTSDLTHYFTYDSLYCHCGPGAIISCLVFVAAGVLFGVGTTLENAGAEDKR